MAPGRRTWLWIAGGVSLFLAACGSGSDAQPPATPLDSALSATAGPGVTDETILIGMTNDMAGIGLTPYGAVTRAMQAYLSKLNEDGGVCGRSIELRAEDDEYDPKKALAATKKLVEKDKVLAMVGGVGTEVHKPAGKYLNDPNGDGKTEDGIPDLFVSSGWSGWYDTKKYPWSVGFIPPFTVDGAALGVYARNEFEGKKVGVLYRNDEFGKEYLAGVAAAMGGSNKVASEDYTTDEVDVAVQVGQLADQHVEVLVLAATPEVVATAVKAAAALGWAPQLLIGYTSPPGTMAARIGGGTSTNQLEVGFQALDGTISTEYLLSPIEDESNDVMQEHRRTMQNNRGPQVSSLSVYGQALAETLVEALSRSCDNLNRAGLLAAVESMNGFRPSVMLDGIQVSLSHTDHKAIESLQPVQVKGTGEVEKTGDVIALESTKSEE